MEQSPLKTKLNSSPSSYIKTDVLIIGGGFAGFSCFREINRKNKRVILLTNRNHFLFTPLLPLASVGSVEVRSIIESVHLYEKNNGEVVIGKALETDGVLKKVRVEYPGGDHGEIGYEKLVIAAGAETNTFGIPGVSEHCFFMREMKHARLLREKILMQFDKASSLPEQAQKASLRFVVVGAGATGVEVACEIEDLIQSDLKRHYESLAEKSEIIIIEATKDILAAFDRRLANYAKSRMIKKGIVIRTEQLVDAVEKSSLVLKTGEIIETDTILWATGNGANAFIKKIFEGFSIPLHRSGRVPVDSNLNIPAHPEIFVIGDCSASVDKNSEMIPATAQAAMKQGIYVGKLLSGKKQQPFSFKSLGMLASLGSGDAIADLGFLRIQGMLAWWFWKAAYLTRLVSFRNKVSVAFDWLKVKFLGRSTARVDFD